MRNEAKDKVWRAQASGRPRAQGSNVNGRGGRLPIMQLSPKDNVIIRVNREKKGHVLMRKMVALARMLLRVQLLLLLLLLLAASLLCSSVQTPVAVEAEWQAWKTQYGVSYDSEATEFQRRAVFASNARFIEAHNGAASSATSVHPHRVLLRMNQFGDLNLREFAARHLAVRSRPPPPPPPGTLQMLALPGTAPDSMPAAIDWRNHSAVSNVSNQGGCGACYAFAAVGAIEGAVAIHGSKGRRPAQRQSGGQAPGVVPLSVQQVVDCSAAEGNMGCRAGNMAMTYVRACTVHSLVCSSLSDWDFGVCKQNYTVINKGLDTAAAYPWAGKASGACSFTSSSVGGTISGWRQVSGSPDGTAPVNVSSIQRAVGTMGPVAVGIDANSMLMQFYHGGFYAGNCTFTGGSGGFKICMGDCGRTAKDLNHAVLIVG